MTLVNYSFQLFKREEHNFVTVNEIDNMALIMPSQGKGQPLTVTKADSSEQEKDRGLHLKKRRSKAKDGSYTSLNVACLKRLLPIGLNLFGGREQELVQQAKDRLIKVR